MQEEKHLCHQSFYVCNRRDARRRGALETEGRACFSPGCYCKKGLIESVEERCEMRLLSHTRITAALSS